MIIKPHVCLSLVFIAFQATCQINPDNIEIIRDKWGVPHIYAPTDAEVAYGLAWAHSEDDFETIQLPLLSGKQMLGQYLGKDGAGVDYVVHLLRLDQLSRSYYKSMTPEFREIVKAYTAGINAFAEHNPKRILLKKAFPINEIDVLKAYGISLAVISGADQTIKHLVTGDLDKLDKSVNRNGSNAIALSRERTTDDLTYLAINSHQPLEGPSAWYEAHLVSEEGWNMMGGLFPGGPVIFHGTNENLGWAHTVNYPDKIDVYKLELNPANPNQYKLDDEWVELEATDVKLKVKLPLGLKLSVKKEILWSKFGPTIKNDKGTYSFHMSTLEDIGAIEQWYRMNKSQNFDEFKTALTDISIPGFNIVYADKESNIYHIGYGKIPLRAEGYEWQKIVPGNTKKVLPNGYHDFEDLPANENPKSGFIFNMNNSAFSSSTNGSNPLIDKYDPTMGYLQWENNRSIRILDLIGQYDNVSYDDFKKMKYDITLPDSLVYPIDINGLWSLSSDKFSDKATEVKAIIESWDKVAGAKSVGPAQATIVYYFLQKELEIPYRSYYRPNIKQLEIALSRTHDYFMKHFKRLNVEMGEFQLLVRGDKEFPMQAVDDVIASIRSAPYKKGRYKAIQGESYIMMVRYPENGLPIIETVNVYGASNVQGSTHFDDQMPLFLNQELKSMTLDIEKVREEAERIYNPK